MLQTGPEGAAPDRSRPAVQTASVVAPWTYAGQRQREWRRTYSAVPMLEASPSRSVPPCTGDKRRPPQMSDDQRRGRWLQVQKRPLSSVRHRLGATSLKPLPAVGGGYRQKVIDWVRQGPSQVEYWVLGGVCCFERVPVPNKRVPVWNVRVDPRQSRWRPLNMPGRRRPRRPTPLRVFPAHAPRCAERLGTRMANSKPMASGRLNSMPTQLCEEFCALNFS